MPDHLGDDMRKTKVEENKEEKEIKGMFRYFKFYIDCIFFSTLFLLQLWTKGILKYSKLM